MSRAVYRCAQVGLLGMLLAAATMSLARAQDGPVPDGQARWAVVVDGAEAEWPSRLRAPAADSVAAAARALVIHYRRRGYLHATVDSAAVHAESLPRATFYVDPGRQTTVASVAFTGADGLGEARLRREMRLQPGEPFNQYVLDADMQALRQMYREAGYPLATVGVASVRPAGPEAVALQLALDAGPRLRLKAVQVQGAERTRPAYVARAAGLAFGAPIREYDPDVLQQRLRNTGLFERVGRPALQIEPDGGATLTVAVKERPPGVFDLVVGVLPSREGGAGPSFVGSGRLALENVFGGGREADLALDRRPGRSSTVDVRVRDPFVLGRALDAEVVFAGEQRDSSYSARTYRGSLGYAVRTGWHLRASVRRSVTRPGPQGQALRNGTQRVARSRVWMGGVGLRIDRTDRRQAPRRGLRADVLLEQGRQRRGQRVVVQGDTTRTQRTTQQTRVNGQVRAFWPLAARHTLMLGADARALWAGAYDRSDLFRLGGYASLRGYDEDRFTGRLVGRGLAEYRVFVDRTSFVFVFAEVGGVDAPARGEQPGSWAWYPSGGLGAELRTGLGRVNISYAMNPDDGSPANGRVHVGLAVAL